MRRAVDDMPVGVQGGRKVLAKSLATVLLGLAAWSPACAQPHFDFEVSDHSVAVVLTGDELTIGGTLLLQINPAVARVASVGCEESEVGKIERLFTNVEVGGFPVSFCSNAQSREIATGVAVEPLLTDAGEPIDGGIILGWQFEDAEDISAGRTIFVLHLEKTGQSGECARVELLESGKVGQEGPIQTSSITTSAFETVDAALPDAICVTMDEEEVPDTEPPSIIVNGRACCGACEGLSVEAECAGAGSWRIAYTANATDDHGVAEFSCDVPSGSTIGDDVSEFECEATDTSGNLTRCVVHVERENPCRPVTLQGSSEIEGTVGEALRVEIGAVGGVEPLRWSAEGLPPGIRLDATHRLLVGAPTRGGTWDAVVTVKDSCPCGGAVDMLVFSFRIVRPPDPPSPLSNPTSGSDGGGGCGGMVPTRALNWRELLGWWFSIASAFVVGARLSVRRWRERLSA